MSSDLTDRFRTGERGKDPPLPQGNGRDPAVPDIFMKLSMSGKVSYGLGAVGKDMVYMLSASYVLYYFQDVMGVSAIAMGIILMAARVFDAFNDPVMGVLVAKTKTRWGKFRPWLLIGTLTNAVILVIMFSAPPALDGAGLVTIFLADTVDYGELKNGRRDESVIFSMQTLVVKLASGIAALIASICLAVFNLSSDSVTEAQQTVDFSAGVSAASKAGLRMTMTVIPIIGLFVGLFWFKKKFILTEEKMAEIAGELKAKD